MRKQEFRFQTNLPSPARRGSRSRTASPPAPLAIRKAPSGRRRKSRRQSHKFFKHLLRLAPQLAATPWGGSPPRPLCQKICYSDCTKNCPLRPLRAPRRVSESENRPATRGTAHSEVQGDARCTARCNVRPIAALHFLLPTGDSRSGRRSLIPNSSPFSRSTRFPFTYRFAARAPCDSKDSEWAAKEKPTPISQIF